MPEQTPESVWIVKHPSGLLLISTTELSESACIEAFEHMSHFRWSAASVDGYTCREYRLVPVEESKNG